MSKGTSGAPTQDELKHFNGLEKKLKSLSPEARAKHVLQLTQGTSGYSQDVWRRVEFVQAKPGRALFRFVITEKDCNYNGSIHGALLALLVDNCTTVMLYTLDNTPLSGGVSTDLHVSYDSGAKLGDTILIDAYIKHQTSSFSFTSADLLLEKPASPASSAVASAGFANPNQHNQQTKSGMKLIAHASHTKYATSVPKPKGEKVSQQQHNNSNSNKYHRTI
ncbi:HotDog domain-containing protein [Syncephalis plumigaleata]|nr:HotDog domain-containing protein [Syncephalis plumigaleata]